MRSTPKQMTVSEVAQHIAENGLAPCRSIANGLVGVTIIADPEPRPDFASMPADKRLSWCMDHPAQMIEFASFAKHIDNDITTLANHIADWKGMTR